MATEDTLKESKDKKEGMSILSKAASLLIAGAALVLFLTFFPVLKEEAKYLFSPKSISKVVLTKEEAKETKEKQGLSDKEIIVPKDEEFGIVVPKIGANAAIVPDIDWQDENAYQRALTKGVAHAKGTARPGEGENIFLFAHSGVDFYEAARYNAVFYLIGKLEPGDTIGLFYQGKKYVYSVEEKKLVSPEEISYVKGDTGKETLTLMTCWPAGTTLSRLVIIAKPKEEL